tara:strand:- start:248 stop:544 length:297 start_codon:yes stop_codon:yes gene_type:complete
MENSDSSGVIDFTLVTGIELELLPICLGVVEFMTSSNTVINATRQLKAVALQTRPIRERTGSTAIAPKERVLRKLAQLSNNKQQASTMITPTIIMGKL